MIPICPLPPSNSFNAVTDEQFRVMNIDHWVHAGLTIQEAEEFEEIVDTGDGMFEDRYNYLCNKMNFNFNIHQTSLFDKILKFIGLR